VYTAEKGQLCVEVVVIKPIHSFFCVSGIPHRLIKHILGAKELHRARAPLPGQ
jgi:hypothetical protein